MTKLGIVAGESSGDQLGAQLIEALRQYDPEIEIFGMCGPKMRAAGCQSLADIEELSVMGLVEVLRKYPSLRKLRTRLTKDLIALDLDAFVGIDVPDFVHYIERQLKKQGVKTAHYVAPQVWAWRPNRAKKLAKTIEMLLVLFPFERDFFCDYGVDTRFVGHPLVKRIPEPVQRESACERLNLDPEKKYIAIMPGSRRQELVRHCELFFEVAEQLGAVHGDYQFLVGAVHEGSREYIQQKLGAFNCRQRTTVVVGQSHEVLAVADVALVVSGTVTMEALVSKTPMVVAIRVAGLSYQILKRLVKTPYVAMPNVLARKAIVPEFVQDDATVDNLVSALNDWLTDGERNNEFYEQATALRASLSVTDQHTAAAAVHELLTVSDSA